MTATIAPPSIITYLIGQQRQVSLLFSQLEKLRNAPSEQARGLVQQAVIGLMKNSVVEEIHLFPFVRDRLPGGDEIADREIAALAEAEQTMKELEGLDPDDPHFWPTIHTLMGQVKAVVHEQEFMLFPLMQKTCSNDELVTLGVRAQESAQMSPTRPHPNSPKEGAALQMLAPGVGLVDRIRDVITGRGH
ncbi:hypothetical protein SAMN05216266_1496 [Amycolatopsis marina]|uniref:Uncharacterized protein n=3 Tax=Pseudonocardiaceae TaxID=2070 RepID=A0A2V4ACV3_9PSEU|nr:MULTISPECIES: hypothetical protein [Pseudonocardiaceae]MBE1579546.1 hypothetical protein [Amycolatopsis roodepoortensis]OLZ51816.1 hypothetical protein BS330_24470 [Amycolatopsis keratiniphila subsp. nogabecina]PXY16949.1 hypothetical protein BAY60_35105 [Prauserella muralis]TWE15003.1 hypothetical protein FHX69_7175 [Prauserella muralis]SDU62762.1 hypothetical protein SAMN04489733_7274 [Amycolatopsis keratiniphila]